MRFLFEKQAKEVERDFNSEDDLSKQVEDEIKNKGKKYSLAEIKPIMEQEKNVEYDNLSTAEKLEFIQEATNNSSNSDTLSKARLAVSNAIKDSDLLAIIYFYCNLIFYLILIL